MEIQIEAKVCYEVLINLYWFLFLDHENILIFEEVYEFYFFHLKNHRK